MAGGNGNKNAATAQGENKTMLGDLAGGEALNQENITPAAGEDDTASKTVEETASEKSEVVIGPPGDAVFVKLTGGATYRFRGQTFQKDVPTPVVPEIAAKLLGTGLFAKG